MEDMKKTVEIIVYFLRNLWYNYGAYVCLLIPSCAASFHVELRLVVLLRLLVIVSCYAIRLLEESICVHGNWNEAPTLNKSTIILHWLRNYIYWPWLFAYLLPLG